MEDVDLRYAKEHLDELIARAARGEDVRISEPGIATVRLTLVSATAKPERRPGRWKDKLPDPPPDFFEPMSDEELKDWYGNEP